MRKELHNLTAPERQLKRDIKAAERKAAAAVMANRTMNDTERALRTNRIKELKELLHDLTAPHRKLKAELVAAAMEAKEAVMANQTVNETAEAERQASIQVVRGALRKLIERAVVSGATLNATSNDTVIAEIAHLEGELKRLTKPDRDLEAAVKAAAKAAAEAVKEKRMANQNATAEGERDARIKAVRQLLRDEAAPFREFKARLHAAKEQAARDVKAGRKVDAMADAVRKVRILEVRAAIAKLKKDRQAKKGKKESAEKVTKGPARKGKKGSAGRGKKGTGGPSTPTGPSLMAVSTTTGSKWFTFGGWGGFGGWVIGTAGGGIDEEDDEDGDDEPEDDDDEVDDDDDDDIDDEDDDDDGDDPDIDGLTDGDDDDDELESYDQCHELEGLQAKLTCIDEVAARNIAKINSRFGLR